MIELPDKKKCYNLPEQVAQNLRNITFLAEQYKNIDALPTIWQTYKEEFDRELETFGEWTTTFEGWSETLSTYLANMSSAAVGAIAGQNIAPAAIAATGPITAPSITESMSGYTFTKYTLTTPIEVQYAYAGIVKTGNKITLAIAGTMIRKDTVSDAFVIARFGIPTAIGQKLFPFTGSTISYKKLFLAPNSYSGIELFVRVLDYADSILEISVSATGANDMSLNTNYYFRFEETYLLSDNLAA